jgi:hypothetical protein
MAKVVAILGFKLTANLQAGVTLEKITMEATHRGSSVEYGEFLLKMRLQ